MHTELLALSCLTHHGWNPELSETHHLWSCSVMCLVTATRKVARQSRWNTMPPKTVSYDYYVGTSDKWTFSWTHSQVQNDVKASGQTREEGWKKRAAPWGWPIRKEESTSLCDMMMQWVDRGWYERYEQVPPISQHVTQTTNPLLHPPVTAINLCLSVSYQSQRTRKHGLSLSKPELQRRNRDCIRAVYGSKQELCEVCWRRSSRVPHVTGLQYYRNKVIPGFRACMPPPAECNRVEEHWHGISTPGASIMPSPELLTALYKALKFGSISVSTLTWLHTPVDLGCLDFPSEFHGFPKSVWEPKDSTKGKVLPGRYF